MDNKITAGIRGEKSAAVTVDLTAPAMGSGELKVFATPALAALAEGCCAESVEDLLDEGQETVGSRIEVDHISPTPMGVGVVCRSRLLAAEGRRLDFEFEAYDSGGMIGKGKHTRYIVDAEALMKKATDKLKK